MSYNAPNPDKPGFHTPHATVIEIDGLTGYPARHPSATPQTITAGQRTFTTATILADESVSQDIDIGLMRLGRIDVPAAWTAADITLQVSHDGASWKNFRDVYGAEYSVPVVAGEAYSIPPADVDSIQHLRVRSGTSAAPVNQTAARAVILTLVP